MLVIDMQVDVVGDCFDRDGVMARTGALIERARAAGIAVIYVQNEDEDTPHGTPGWQLAAPLAPRPGEPVVFKQYRDSFAATPLTTLLTERDISRLLLAGAQSDFCVGTTALSAAAQGYDCVLISDCHTTRDAAYDGITVSGEQLIAHTNRYFSGLRYPGGTFALATHDEVDLTPNLGEAPVALDHALRVAADPEDEEIISKLTTGR